MRWLLIFFVMLLLASGLPGWMRKIGLGRLPGSAQSEGQGEHKRSKAGHQWLHVPSAEVRAIASPRSKVLPTNPSCGEGWPPIGVAGPNP